MPDDRLPPDDPGEWLNRASSNLSRAVHGAQIPDVYWEDLCYDAQQAAEKALKAVLLARTGGFPFVHDLGVLITLAKESGLKIPPRLVMAVQLTRYAVMTRYPGLAEPVTRQEYEEAVSVAKEVVAWARRIIVPSRHSSPD